MAKFFIGVVVGIFLGASGSVYGAVDAGSGTLSGWTVTKHGEAIIIFDRPATGKVPSQFSNYI
jgi:hypothetical protein